MLLQHYFTTQCTVLNLNVRIVDLDFEERFCDYQFISLQHYITTKCTALNLHVRDADLNSERGSVIIDSYYCNTISQHSVQY